MSPSDAPQPLMPSVLDRLIDASTQPAPAPTAWYGVNEMVGAVERDLGELLNTRQTHQGLCDDFPEVQNSLVTYGLPDLAWLNANTLQERLEIGRMIEAVVRRFEPRLKDVRSVLLDSPDPKEKAIRFRVEARLSLDPAPDVAFHTTLELGTGHYSVKAEA